MPSNSLTGRILDALATPAVPGCALTQPSDPFLQMAHRLPADRDLYLVVGIDELTARYQATRDINQCFTLVEGRPADWKQLTEVEYVPVRCDAVWVLVYRCLDIYENTAKWWDEIQLERENR